MGKAWSYLFPTVACAADIDRQKVTDTPRPIWKELYEPVPAEV